MADSVAEFYTQKAREEAERKARENMRRLNREAAARARDEAGRERRAREVVAEVKVRAEASSRMMKRAFLLVACTVTIGVLVKVRDGCRHTEIADANRAAAAKIATAYGVKFIDLGSGVTLEMIRCPGVAEHFWIGKYEVTQEQWKCVMGTDPSHFKGARRPVECVTWNDCREFVRRLNMMAAQKEGLTFRLPSEAEWVAACRAGAPSHARYCGIPDGTQITSSNLSRVALYGKKWDDGPINVGSLEPNAWGLYDMLGNVWEWTDTAVGNHRKNLGGGFHNNADEIFSAVGGDRASSDGSRRSLGFRLAASGGGANR